MSWIDKEKIAYGVRNMLNVNMGIKQGERIMVVTDVLSPECLPKFSSSELEVILRRTYLARVVTDIAKETFPDNQVEYYGFEATCQPGSEPPSAAAEKFRQTDILIAIVSYSLTHTDAREQACRSGVRVASMPRFVPEMFYTDGPMTVDYKAIAVETKAIADRMTATEEVTIKSPDGTDIIFSIKGRLGQRDDGLYTYVGAWGNLPAGEAYTAPIEGTGKGRLVVRKGWFPGLIDSNMTLVFEEGEVISVEGSGDLPNRLTKFLDLPARGAAARPRRILAELGVGTNPNARRIDINLEAEKIRGTVHLAIGDSSHMGGTNVADFHQDHVIPEADLFFDGKPIMLQGKLLL